MPRRLMQARFRVLLRSVGGVKSGWRGESFLLFHRGWMLIELPAADDELMYAAAARIPCLQIHDNIIEAFIPLDLLR